MLFRSFSVNAIGTALIIVVFASTGGLVGGEIAVAGGTAVVAQRVLEAVFGDDAVRRMATQAREGLEKRVSEFLAEDKGVWLHALEELGVNRELRGTYANALAALVEAKSADGRTL